MWQKVAPPWLLAVFAVLLAGVAAAGQPAALLVPLAGLAVLRVWPPASLGLAVAATMLAALGVGDAVPVWSVATMLAAFVVSVLAGRRMPRPVPALVVVAVVALPFAGTDARLTGPLLLPVTVLLPWLLGRSLWQQDALAAVRVERARLEERGRIASDMHDTLGHDLTLLALRAGALELAAGLDDRHRAAAAEIRAGAGQATERLAEIVTVLRAGEPPPAGIEELVDRAARAGVAVSLDWHGTRALPPPVGVAAHRVVREALTNAVKHAPGAPVRVRLHTAAGVTTATVTNAVTPSVEAAGARAGLSGLRERVRQLGGTLNTGPRGDTFEVVARLPHRS